MKVRSMPFLLSLFSFVILFVFDSYAYEIVHETITVTPGFEGGVLYSKTESGYISSKFNNLNLNLENTEPITEEEKEDRKI